MLTNAEAASASSVAAARYEAPIAQTIPASDASLRAAIISAITLGVMVSRHLIKSDELATADPAQVISLLRPCMTSLAAQPRPAPLAIALNAPGDRHPNDQVPRPPARKARQVTENAPSYPHMQGESATSTETGPRGPT